MSRQARLTIHVAAGILRNSAGEVLLAERLCDGPYNGLWEFPGGKVEDHETAEFGLRRELREEIGIDVIDSEPYMRIAHDYDDRSVDLEFFLVKDWLGTPAGLEGQRIRWTRPAELDMADLLPADAPLLDALRRDS